MNQIITFITTGPWNFFMAAVLVFYIIDLPFQLVFRCWNRWLRSRNIRERGWPPIHLDAYGNAVKDDE